VHRKRASKACMQSIWLSILPVYFVFMHKYLHKYLYRKRASKACIQSMHSKHQNNLRPSQQCKGALEMRQQHKSKQRRRRGATEKQPTRTIGGGTKEEELLSRSVSRSLSLALSLARCLSRSLALSVCLSLTSLFHTLSLLSPSLPHSICPSHCYTQRGAGCNTPMSLLLDTYAI
jgi:hypothetical protein